MAPPRKSRIDPGRPDPVLVAEAAELLRGGGLVIFATDTVYGIAAHPGCPDAVQALYRLKQRPAGKPIARLAAGPEQLEAAGVTLSEPARRLAEACWPGPLTLVVDTPEGPTGFRVPDHPVARAVIRAAGVPLPVTSANPSGAPDACDAAEAAAYFQQGVDLILDSGPTSVQVPSTVVSVTADGLEVLREGAVSQAFLERFQHGE